MERAACSTESPAKPVRIHYSFGVIYTFLIKLNEQLFVLCVVGKSRVRTLICKKLSAGARVNLSDAPLSTIASRARSISFMTSVGEKIRQIGYALFLFVLK